jgi:hypothetical protein
MPFILPSCRRTIRPPAPAGEDIEKRTALERQFQELCDREEVLMRELAAHLTAPAAHGGGAVAVA